ncbi:class I SAM-dependent methyltransferase [Micromonospora sp. C28SCA-DRY-2]|uniref:class I SAM-dependent methyltransferase n=1 Tax=Micromonospora sp. C28SCA-DRY-2 TaxID=3059522 RepID=UPI002675F6A4|nr:class I SAM-dependent methyltransferase [Micromonospora sp. C28SCA-DRY-2]MDO3705890.1 class I SAM-dependent methyltransferase [Micromonospora sp. C28SCA-DRY-2]
MTTDTAPPVALPGGEMLAWSDLPAVRLATGGPLAALVARVVPAGARVLLAGPHDPALLDRLAHAEVTCLLRSYPDGVALADRATRVVVGGPAGLPDDGPYDVVVAAAGLDAVESVEGPRLGWAAVLARLVAALRPGGDLLLRLDNPLGVHRLVAASPWYAAREDSAWTVGGVLDAAYPANLDRLRDRLAGAGLDADTCFAAYPRPDATTALLDAAALARRTDSGLFDAVLHGACAGGFAGREVLRDPARLAVDALHAGRAADLAPGWLVLARKATGPDRPAAGDRPDLPVALVQTGPPGVGVVEVVDAPDGWRWRADRPAHRGGPAAPYATREAAYRDPAELTGPVAEGRLLRTLLLDGCLRRDLDGLRRLLRGYAAWLAGQAGPDGRLAGAVALAGVDNVVLAGDRYAVLDPSWRAAEPLPGPVVLARALWRFATELLTGGYAHPWPSTLDVAGLTIVLGGLAGHDLSRATVDAAVETEAAVTAALHGLDSDRRVALAGELRAVEPTDPPPGPRSYQQLREAWLRQREELTRLGALLKWTEELLTSRERALRRADATIQLLSGSLSYRVGRLAITPARLAKRGARAAKRRARAALGTRQEEQQ